MKRQLSFRVTGKSRRYGRQCHTKRNVRAFSKIATPPLSEPTQWSARITLSHSAVPSEAARKSKSELARLHLKLSHHRSRRKRSSRQWLEHLQFAPREKQHPDAAWRAPKVEQLRGVSYDLKANGKREVGVIAEEVGAAVPEVVTWEEDGKNTQSVDYSRHSSSGRKSYSSAIHHCNPGRGFGQLATVRLQDC